MLKTRAFETAPYKLSTFRLSLHEYFLVLLRHGLIHLLCRLGAIVIEPSGDDGAESVDKKRGVIVTCRVVAYGFETRAELFGVGFYIVKHTSEILLGIECFGDGCIVREHFQDSIFLSQSLYSLLLISSARR